MKVSPILFSGPMVRAILREIENPGTGKTQTRRVIKPQPTASGKVMFGDKEIDEGEWQIRHGRFIKIAVGDRLYVREHWRTASVHDETSPRDLHSKTIVEYVADGGNLAIGKHRQAMHMPRWASRLTLIVTDVRVERLQDISREDAISEGLEWVSPTFGIAGIASSWNGDPRLSFAALWDSINAAPSPVKGDDGEISHFVSYPWDGKARVETFRGKPHHVIPNPWVVAYTFRPILGNVDQIGGANA